MPEHDIPYVNLRAQADEKMPGSPPSSSESCAADRWWGPVPKSNGSRGGLPNIAATDEGSVWEAAACADKHRLSNLTAIID